MGYLNDPYLHRTFLTTVPLTRALVTLVLTIGTTPIGVDVKRQPFLDSLNLWNFFKECMKLTKMLSHISKRQVALVLNDLAFFIKMTPLELAFSMLTENKASLAPIK